MSWLYCSFLNSSMIEDSFLTRSVAYDSWLLIILLPYYYKILNLLNNNIHFIRPRLSIIKHYNSYQRQILFDFICIFKCMMTAVNNLETILRNVIPMAYNKKISAFDLQKRRKINKKRLKIKKIRKFCKFLS